jgi:predicted helicase
MLQSFSPLCQHRAQIHAHQRWGAPCGTGKTLVQLWAAEQHGADTVSVLVPSLALLSQTLDEWSRQTSCRK